MKEQTGMTRLLSWMQEEITAQQELGKLLETQRKAVLESDIAGLAASEADIERQLRSGVERSRRRDALVRAFAKAFGVDAKTLTLASLCERLAERGQDVDTLRKLRQELRLSTADVLSSGRTVAALARFQRGLAADLCALLLGANSEGEDQQGLTGNEGLSGARGQLVDTRG